VKEERRTMNYHSHGKTINWRTFAREVIQELDSLDAKYYIKKDLDRHIGHPEGIRKGGVG